VNEIGFAYFSTKLFLIILDDVHGELVFEEEGHRRCCSFSHLGALFFQKTYHCFADKSRVHVHCFSFFWAQVAKEEANEGGCICSNSSP